MFREVKGFVSLFFHTDDFGVDQMERIIRLNPKLKPLLSKNLSCFSLLIFPSFWMDSLFFSVMQEDGNYASESFESWSWNQDLKHSSKKTNWQEA